MKTDLDIIAEQCAEIDRRNGEKPLPPVRRWHRRAPVACSACAGSGRVYKRGFEGRVLGWTTTCYRCKGTGRQNAEREVRT